MSIASDLKVEAASAASKATAHRRWGNHDKAEAEARRAAQLKAVGLRVRADEALVASGLDPNHTTEELHRVVTRR